MTLNPGELYHTTRGIVEIQSFYNEDGLDKVRFWLHLVNPDDGVTATGETVLMSTTPDNLQGWMDRFPRDITERKRTVSALKDFQPSERARVDEILERIKTAELSGPKVIEAKYTAVEEEN